MSKISFSSTLCFLIVFIGCSSVGNSVSNENPGSEETVSDDKDYYIDLADYLRQVQGLNVSGFGANVTVTVRGVNSFNLSINPLYVIDGQAIGNSYSEANSMISPRDID